MRRLASQRVRATGGTAWTSLVEDLRPRVRELRYSIHLLRRSLLAMVGLGIVLFFLVLAVTGPFLDPTGSYTTTRRRTSLHLLARTCC